MPTHHDDEQFESYLKQFRPLAPGSLPDKKHERAARRKLMFAVWAAAAAAAIVAAVLTMHHRPEPALLSDGTQSIAGVESRTNPEPLTLGRANALLAHSPSVKAAVDLLATPSPTTQFTKGMQSALAVLGKENTKL